MDSFPKKGKQLFISGGSTHEYSHIALENEERQFRRYIDGYKNSADILVHQALEDGSYAVLDTFVYPIVYLYRHYVELTLKDIYLLNTKDSEDDKIKTIDRCQHNLMKMWFKAKPLISSSFPKDDMSVLDVVEDYISQLSEVDIQSFAFRYPITKRLSPVRDKAMFINLPNLAACMRELEYFLYSVSAGMDYQRECEGETMS